MSKIAIISGADSGYWHLLQGLRSSLFTNHGALAFDFCVLDLGLSDQQLSELMQDQTVIARPEWDIDFPDRVSMPEHFKAMVCRPFLTKYFPGYDIYVWIDADAWIQDEHVLKIYIDAAEQGQLSITAQVDRAYKALYKRQKLFGWTHNHKHYRLGWGWRTADRYGRYPILNSGAFALARDAPHWEAWQNTLREGLQRTTHPLVEQTALNLVVYRDKLNSTFLPAYCNWLCDAAHPMVEEEAGNLVEPNAPHQTLGIVHLAGEFERNHDVILKTRLGDTVETKLQFSDWQSTRERLVLEDNS